MILHDYQENLSARIDSARNEGVRHILAVMATGGGKSILMAYRAKLMRGLTLIMAHRQELVFQLSMALASLGLEHRIIAPSVVVNFIVEKHIERFKRSFVYAGAQHAVASVDTLLSRADDLGKWRSQVELVQPDEAHHLVGAIRGDMINKWGHACRLFPNAESIGWTATAGRLDRKPLRTSFDRLILGPNSAELLARGFLCPFKIFAPHPSIDMTGALIGEGGDYSKKDLSARAAKSTIVGDILDHYQKFAPGKVGIGFATDVEQAKLFAERFQNAGIPCEWMSAKETDDRKRVRTMDALRNADIKLIFNVGLLGEGVDVPRVEVVIDACPTKSFVNYLQRVGRLLRLFPGKTQGVYVDAVANVIEHGMPTRTRNWSLDEPERRKKSANDEEALTACTSCYMPYSKWKSKCPHCEFKPVSQGGGRRPEEVDGDLLEYTPELLASLNKTADKIVGPCPAGQPPYVERNWNARATLQTSLRDAIDWWMSTQVQITGLDASSAYRLFYHRFGTDTATAQTLDGPNAEKLTGRLWEDMNNYKR